MQKTFQFPRGYSAASVPSQVFFFSHVCLTYKCCFDENKIIGWDMPMRLSLINVLPMTI